MASVSEAGVAGVFGGHPVACVEGYHTVPGPQAWHRNPPVSEEGCGPVTV
jgi:hypothetical protein